MKTAKKFIVLGADPVKTHGNFILPPAPSYTSPPRAPQTAAFVLSFSLCFFCPSDPDVCRCGRSRSVQDFSHAAGSGSAHGPHVMAMLRLMGIIGKLRARPSGGGRRDGAS